LVGVLYGECEGVKGGGVGEEWGKRRKAKGGSVYFSRVEKVFTGKLNRVAQPTRGGRKWKWGNRRSGEEKDGVGGEEENFGGGER